MYQDDQPDAPQPNKPVPPPHIQNDYWAPDREQVLNDPSRWGPAPGAATPPPPPPTGGYDRERFKNEYLGSGVKNTAEQQAWIAAHPEFSTGVKTLAGKSGKIVLPDGAVLDAGEAFSTGNGKPAWMGVGDMGANGQINPYAPSGGGMAGMTGAAGASGGSAFQDQIRSLLMQQLQGFAKPVSADDPGIQGEMTAQKNLLDRQAQQQRASTAERAAFQGLLNGGQSSGAFDTDVRGIQENEGQQLSGLQAQLFNRELQSRRDKMAQLLSLATQSGDAESARALQMQLAQMDDQLKRASMAQSQSQFNDQFGLNAGQFQYQKDRDAALFGGG